MPHPSLGIWLRAERERRGITIKTIADQTKVSAPLLEGLESDNVERWPAGIYRRSFVRAYAGAVGLDPADVWRRFEQEHGVTPDVGEPAAGQPASTDQPAVATGAARPVAPVRASSRLPSTRARVLGTAADLAVALVLAMGSAAAGSRLLWPVLLIAAYYALGILVTGTSPMVRLLLPDQPAQPSAPEHQPAAESQPPRGVPERRHQPRRNTQRARSLRGPRPRVQ